MASALFSSDELWRECADWLTRCEVIRGDHRVNLPTAGIVHLATILRDGVLLCNLLNLLDPGCIDLRDVNQKPHMAQFLCLRNIHTFLQSCRDIFGVKESDLFEPLMLFDLTNFHQVLYTLSKLSNSPRALKNFSPGFSAHKNGSKEDIYQSLQTIDAPVHQRQWHDENDHAEYGSYYSHIKNEEIYHDLCATRPHAQKALNASNRVGFNINNSESSTTPPVEKRDHVIKELLDTEKNYVDVLYSLKHYFRKPLAYHIGPEFLNSIFKEIPELHDIHSGFHKELKTFMKTGKPELSSIFLKWREKFLIYGSYCANLTYAQALLQELCDRDELFNQEVFKCQNEANKGKFKLRDVLSVPMQRILKYHLLLQKLIEETQPKHDEYQALKRAREAMVDVASYINEVKRDSDHLLLLKQVQENITDWNISADCPLESYGHLLKDGELKIKSHDDQKVHSRYVFIFDKIMILCKSIRGNQFSYKESLLLNEYYVEDVTNRSVLNKEARWSYQWLLVKKNKTSVYTLYARSIDLKKKMISAINEALDNLEPSTLRNTNHKFIITTFPKSVTCNRCSKFLKGLIYQGYSCHSCNIAVHKECIAQSGRCSLPPAIYPHPYHLDDMIRDKLWFAGEMEREAAASTLENRLIGTYLLRIRSQVEEARYALSLKTTDSVRHMRVFRKKMDDTDHYYLSESRFFKNILDLVQFYEHTSLKENYERLEENAKLQWPYRQLLALVECSFEPEENNHLRLKQGIHVRVFKTDGEFWKGKFGNQTGYFPKQCVKIVEEVTHDQD